MVSPVASSAPAAPRRGPGDWLLAGLDGPQREAVVHQGRSLAVLAGPGSGKTRVLTTRVARRVVLGDADPARTLVVTFTRRAAGELRERLGRFGLVGPRAPQVRTLHALAAVSLRRAWLAAGERPWAMAPYPLRILAPEVQRAAADGWPIPDARGVQAEISWSKTRAVGPDGYASAAGRAGRLAGWDEAAREGVGLVYGAYEAEKTKRHLLDVDDLLPALAARLSADRAFGEAMRWHHRHLFVDEFQDLGRGAFRLVRGLLATDPAALDLFVVGDADQSVYGFAGSDPRLLTRLAEAVPGTDVLTLSRTRRCSPPVLGAAWAVRDGVEPDLAAVQAACVVTADAPTERGEGPVAGLAFDDVEAEAAHVAWSLRKAHAAGRAWSSLAVLARTNTRLDAVATACEREGIPTRSRRNLLDRPEVRQALDSLQWRPPELRAAVVRSTIRELAAEALDHGLAPAARRSLAALAALSDEYVEMAPNGTLDSFLAWLDATVRAEGGEPAEAGDAVDLLTFHRAKGLEWDVVHLVGVEAGAIPRARATPSEVAEERRLLYVALTRARHAVRCTWVAEASPWLLPALATAEALVPRPVAAPGVIRDIRTRLAPTADPLTERIWSWRRARARAAGLAPSTVLPDAALAALVRFHPRTLDEVARVPGVGRARAAALGPSLLELFAALTASAPAGPVGVGG